MSAPAFVKVDVSDLRDCPHCKQLLCKGDVFTCPGKLTELVADMEIAERERQARHEAELDRLRDQRRLPAPPLMVRPS